MCSAEAERLEREYARALDAGGTDPRQRLLALFDTVDQPIQREGFRGCRFVNADLAIPDLTHPAHQVSEGHKREIRNLLAHELRTLGHPDAPAAAEQLQLLIDGALVIGGTRGADGHPGRAAKALAQHVLDEATTVSRVV